MNEILGMLIIVYFDFYAYDEDTEARLYWVFAKIMSKQKEMFMPIK